MDPYAPRRLRPWALPALALRAVIYVLNHWHLFLIAALIASPIGPHLRIQYSYIDYGGGRKAMTWCEYLGSRGLVEHRAGGDCPIITIIDTREVS